MAVLRGFGKYLPVEVRSNTQLAEKLGVTPEWIREATGIVERRVAAENESVVTLGVNAGRDLLDHFPATVQMVLVASGSAERIFPGPASQISHELGLGNIPAVDLPLASAGAIFGLDLAARLTDTTGPILVIATERMSRAALQEPLDKNIAVLFGDGAGACLVAPNGPGYKVLTSALHSDGSNFAELSRGFDGRIFMNGMSVIRNAGRESPPLYKRCSGPSPPTKSRVSSCTKRIRISSTALPDRWMWNHRASTRISPTTAILHQLPC